MIKKNSELQWSGYLLLRFFCQIYLVSFVSPLPLPTILYSILNVLYSISLSFPPQL